MPWGPWPGVPRGGGGAADWFEDRLTDARAAVPAAEFDTLIRVEFDELVTVDVVDRVGTVSADPAGNNGGGLAVNIGDNVEALSQARVERTGAGTYVDNLQARPWYLAALAKYIQPGDTTQLADTAADMVALWADNDNRVMIGVLGNASGGSVTNWVGSIVNGASFTTTLGPALDPNEAPVWHLFEVWNDGAAVHFRIDGAAFAGTLDAADLPVLEATLGPIVQRTAVGDHAAVWWDKIAVVVQSPTIGEP